MKVTIVHDWLYGGGAEMVVLELHTLYPDAPIYTLFATNEWREKLHGKVITGYLGSWPFKKLYKFTPLLQQRWFSRLDLSEYDVVISSSGNGAARFSRVDKPGIHISYTHTPTHYYWRKYDEYLQNPSFRPKWLARIGLKLLVGYLRNKDYEAAQKIDYFIANSEHISADIKTYYDRESMVIHPPVGTERFANSDITNKEETVNKESQEQRFVMWGRHVPYKRFDIAIEACNRLKAKLIVIGEGPDTTKLRELAGPTVKVLGRIDAEQMSEIASSATAFIAPMEEDFGISPVEAQASGLPVIAFRAGGALDYVVDGKTGIFFDKQTPESLMDAIDRFCEVSFNRREIAEYAEEKFDAKVFRKKIGEFVESKIEG